MSHEVSMMFGSGNVDGFAFESSGGRSCCFGDLITEVCWNRAQKSNQKYTPVQKYWPRSGQTVATRFPHGFHTVSTRFPLEFTEESAHPLKKRRVLFFSFSGCVDSSVNPSGNRVETVWKPCGNRVETVWPLHGQYFCTG